MLIGAHVSTAGGLPNAIQRGSDLGCESIQIFNQSPRMWRPTNFEPEDFEATKEAQAGSPIDAVLIHAVYLINCAGSDKELRKKSLTSLTHALRIGDGIDAAGVVLHPGALKGGPHGPALKRSAKAIRHCLDETDHCPLLIEQTSGSPALLGRTFEEIAELIDLAGGDKRLGLCLDSCHLFAQGHDVTTREGMAKIVRQTKKHLGMKRLKALHINDSRDPIGSNRDRHASVGKGEIGNKMSLFLSEPAFEGLPATLETPGPNKRGPDKKEVQLTRRLRERGVKQRAG